VNLETALGLITHHSESIIQWLILAILLMAGYHIARMLLGKNRSEGAGSISLADDADIRKFMQKTAVTALVEAKVQALETQLKAKEEELNKAKSGGGKLPVEAEMLLNGRIKELEARLAEYELLEDDIADLSLYKEENARLRTELDRLKGGSGGEPVTAPPIPPINPSDFVTEFPQAVRSSSAKMQFPIVHSKPKPGKL
jgi:hypothetical protein